jgi:hypothetical protein
MENQKGLSTRNKKTKKKSFSHAKLKAYSYSNKGRWKNKTSNDEMN